MLSVLSRIHRCSGVNLSLDWVRRHRGQLLLTLAIATGVVIGTDRITVPVKSREATVVRAESRGKGLYNFRDGREVAVEYRGYERGVTALRAGKVAPAAVAVADMDDNGTPDLIAGYAANGIGLVTVQSGNPDAYAPLDQSVYPRIQAGYNPEPLLPSADVFEAPIAIEHLVVGNFDGNSQKDVLIASANGGLYLLKGDGRGHLGSPVQLAVSGTISALEAGEFAALDGRTDVAVGVIGANGPSVQVYAASDADKFSAPSSEIRLSAPALAITFGALDDDPFVDLAIASGSEITIVHAAGRKATTPLESRIERIPVNYSAVGVAIGHFVWDRQGREEFSVLAEDGSVQVFARSDLDTRQYTDADRPTRGTHLPRLLSRTVDVELVKGWQANDAPSWEAKGQIATGATAPSLFKKVHMSDTESDDVLVAGADQNLRVVHAVDPSEKGSRESSDSSGLTAVNLDVTSPVVASVMLPRKINGERGLVLMTQNSPNPALVPLTVTATIDVDTTADNAALSACTAAGGDCSLRGAIANANLNVDSTTINLPNNLYVLNINGSTNNGCDGNSTGDLEINETTIIVGGGQATTIIRQTGLGSGGAGTGARVMCLNNTFKLNLTYQFSGLTITGGRSLASSFGGGGIIGGEKDNNHTFTNVTLSNNQATGGTFPGGGIQILGGNTTFTTSLVGGSSAPGADRTNVNLANSDGTSAGGVFFTPSAPQHTASVAIFTSTGTTFSRNTASGSGGGGADMAIVAIALPGGIGSGSGTFTSGTQFNNNQSLVQNGGGLIVSTLPTTVSGASFTSNSAAGQGGGIYVGSASLLLDGTVNAISFTGNTAVANGGSSISVNNATTVSGTLVSIGGDVVVNGQGTWTNNAGSILAPTNFLMFGGIFNGNNSTMNIAGNLSATPQTVGTTFNAGSSTINIGGNFSFTGGGAGPAATFNAGTSTFNFNGTGSQSVSNSILITFFNFTDSNVTQPLTLNNSFNVNGTMTVNGVGATLAPVAATVIGGTGALTGTGTVRVTRTLAVAGFLNQYAMSGAKTLTNLTVHYLAASLQSISATTYGHLRLENPAGADLGGVVTVNGLLTLTSGAMGVGTSTLNIMNGTTVGTGSITSAATGTVNYGQTSNGQDVRAFNYGNLTFSSFTKVLAGAGTIGVAGTFTPGGAVGHTIAGSTINFNGAGAQTIPAFNYFNLTSSSTGGRTLANAGTIGIAGTFTPGTNAYTITGSTVDFNGTGAQGVAAFNYNNLTTSGNRGGAAITFASGNIGVAGVFNPAATNNSYVTTGNTVIFNGAALQSIPVFPYNGLTLNNAAGANLAGSVNVGGALTLTSGVLAVGTNTLTLNGAVSATGGSLTSAVTGTVNYNQGSNGQATVLATNYGNLTFSNFSKTLASTGTIGIAGVFTPGTGTGHTITGSTINFNGAAAQTIPGFTYNNLTSSGGAVSRVLDPVNTIRIAGVFTPGTNVYTITGSTVEYNGSVAQVLPPTFTTYNNLTLNNAAGTTGFAGLTVQGTIIVAAGTFTSSSNYNNVQINPGATLTATAASTINVTGNWTNGGTFNASTGTVIFNGGGAQVIGGAAATTFNNLTITGPTVSLGQSITVSGILTLNNDLTTGANTVVQPSSAPASTGTADVVGNVRRTNLPNPLPTGVALTFGNPNNFINFAAVGARPTDIVVNLVKAAPVGFASAVQRTYTITPTGGGGYSATLRLRYLESELNGNIEGPSLLFRRFNGIGWAPVTPTASDFTANWLEHNAITVFSPWTFNSTNSPTAANGTVTGQITTPEGAPIAGTVVRLSGGQNRKAITDANGNYRFDRVETTGFYAVTPTRANYLFTPATRSFNQLGENTDASFSASVTGDATNPLDTAEYFVRQQYVDLLGREPDEGGFNYWSDRILECGSDALCVNARRRDVAAAFFIEQEYQKTGSFIYGLYKGALGRNPLYSEFSTDRQQLVVGPGLEGNKQSLAENFVGRSEFVARYQSSTTAESFVDAVIDNVQTASGVDLSGQRAAAITNYNSGGTLNQRRSLALRELTEGAAFRESEYNGAFVLTEYFAYLRRDPDAGGYTFWLNVLNNREPGNFRGMVCAFITSAEYQQRFSSIISHTDQECSR